LSSGNRKSLNREDRKEKAAENAKKTSEQGDAAPPRVHSPFLFKLADEKLETRRSQRRAAKNAKKQWNREVQPH
jgi:hypothetical protein